jgi:hypothetical protein
MMGTVSLVRRRRVASNQILFRHVGERVERGRMRLRASGAIAFLCECTRADCRERVPPTLDEYAAIRLLPNHFVVKPGHAYETWDRVAVAVRAHRPHLVFARSCVT